MIFTLRCNLLIHNFMWLVWSDHMITRTEQLNWNHEESNSETKNCSEIIIFLDKFWKSLFWVYLIISSKKLCKYWHVKTLNVHAASFFVRWDRTELLFDEMRQNQIHFSWDETELNSYLMRWNKTELKWDRIFWFWLT